MLDDFISKHGGQGLPEELVVFFHEPVIIIALEELLDAVVERAV